MLQLTWCWSSWRWCTSELTTSVQESIWVHSGKMTNTQQRSAQRFKTVVVQRLKLVFITFNVMICTKCKNTFICQITVIENILHGHGVKQELMFPHHSRLLHPGEAEAALVTSLFLYTDDLSIYHRPSQSWRVQKVWRTKVPGHPSPACSKMWLNE